MAGRRGQGLTAVIVLPAMLLMTWLLEGGTAEFVVDPFLQHVTQESAIVTWETRVQTTTEVWFGDREPLTRRARREGRRHLHQVELTGLPPGQQVFYRVRSKTPSGRLIEGTTHSFRTAPRPGTPLSFAVVGDTQDQPSVWRRIAKRVWGERPQLLVHCGDLVGRGLEKREWTQEFFAPARELLAHVPLQSVLGNHEEDARHWYRYMANPTPEHRYIFTFGDATFFMLDSNRCCADGGAQHAWLDAALASCTSRWRFVVLHHPPYTSDADDYCDGCSPGLNGDPKVQALIPLFERHGVDVVFYGHVHDYERSWPLRQGRVDADDGVLYIQTGGAGGYLEDFAPTRRWFTAKVHRAHHYCMVDLLGNRLELRAYDEDGRLFDRVERIKAPLRTADPTPRASSR